MAGPLWDTFESCGRRTFPVAPGIICGPFVNIEKICRSREALDEPTGRLAYLRNTVNLELEMKRY